MKTPLTELIEDLQDMCPDYYNNNYNWLHTLLDKEKQQRVDNYLRGIKNYDPTFNITTKNLKNK